MKNFTRCLVVFGLLATSAQASSDREDLLQHLAEAMADQINLEKSRKCGELSYLYVHRVGIKCGLGALGKGMSWGRRGWWTGGGSGAS